MKTRSTPIIAVFGSDERVTYLSAEPLGKEIVEAGLILLTGSGGKVNDETVKDRAMRGALAVEKRGGRAPRVGVLGKEEPDVFFKRVDGSLMVRMSLGYENRRNFVEACMCDAAIAFQGGDGTKSEVAFALALGRPVLLVGKKWKAEFPVVRTSDAFEEFVGRAEDRARAKGSDTIDKLVKKAYEVLRIRARDFVVEADDVVELGDPRGFMPAPLVAVARSRATEAGLRGRFPRLSERLDVRAAYETWLGEVEQPG